MGQIDWSRVQPQKMKSIPVLTTHFGMGTHDHSFVKMPDRYIWAPAYNCWHPMSKIDYQDWFFDRLIPIEQYAEVLGKLNNGTPQIGSTVRIDASGRTIWDAAQKFIGVDVVLVAEFRTGDTDMVAVELVSEGQCCCFRADMVKTIEQIAVEEREAAITDIAMIMGKDPDRPFIREKAAIIYDARLPQDRRQITPTTTKE